MLKIGIKRFGKDRRGATAIMFGLCASMLFLVVAVAIDSARVFSVSDKVRLALDAAALAGAKLLDVDDTTDNDVLSRAQAFFDAHRDSISIGGLQLGNFRAVVDRAHGSVTTYVDVGYTSAFGQILNKSLVNFTPSATVVYKTKKIELSMVLDVTGSMSDFGKIDSLKTAANDVLDVLIANNPDPGAVRVAMVPFSAAVNVGTYYNSATGGAAGGDTCVVERNGAHAYTDEAPGAGRYMEISSTASNPNYLCPSPKIMPMSDLNVPSQLTNLRTTINAFVPDGYTAGHIGLGWGWYTVSPTWRSYWPTVHQPRPFGSDVVKAIILMTDGIFNTAYAGGNKNGEDCTVNGSACDQAKQLCDNIKAQGIRIYTVGLQAPPEAEMMLQYCASNPTDYFTATSTADLKTAFRAVAEKLSMLRIAQ